MINCFSDTMKLDTYFCQLGAIGIESVGFCFEVLSDRLGRVGERNGVQREPLAFLVRGFVFGFFNKERMSKDEYKNRCGCNRSGGF